MKLLRTRTVQLLMGVCIILSASCKSHDASRESMSEAGMQLQGDTSALVIIWTSADREVGLKTALAYALNSKLNGWMPNVTVLASGPSVQLIAKDKEIQNVFVNMKQAGISILIDKKSVEAYGLTRAIEDLQLEIRSLGKPLTIFIQQKRTILTF